MNILEKTGLAEIYQNNELNKKEIQLRDGRQAILWVTNDGHGILDPEFWEDIDFYHADYRKQFSATLDTYTSSKDHLKIYKEVNKRQFKQFKKNINDKTKYLEIGCSFGGILQHVNKLNIETCDAIEPNVQDCEFSRNMYKNSNIINDFFENHNFEKKYNLVVSFEVLEHIFNISNFFTKLLSILESSAKVNFEVPNHNDALLINYKVARYQSFYYHKSHVHYFTPESLIRIFSHFRIMGKVKSFQMYPFFNQIYWLYNNSPQGSAKDALKYPCVNANENNINKKIYKFYKKVNSKYQKLMNNGLCGDCLIFKGTKT